MEGSPKHENQDKQSTSSYKDTSTIQSLDKLASDRTPTIQSATNKTDPKSADSNQEAEVKPKTDVSSKPSPPPTIDKTENERGAQTKEEPKIDIQLHRTKSEGAGSDARGSMAEQSHLTGTLNKLMGSLETRRRSSARPDDITVSDVV